jgi:hypothetical protein
MKQFLSVAITSVMLSLAVSCGSNGPQILTGVKVESTTVNNDVMVSVSAEMNLGSMTFPAATIPILNPHGQTPIGQVELVPELGGKNLLKISVNVSELAGIETQSVQLPNGNLVPLIANNKSVSVRLPGGAQLYLAMGSGVTAIGVAVPIAPFDAIGASLPGLNFFPVINLNQVVASAGIFTGRPGQNGIAFIADISKLVNTQGAPSAMGIMAMQAEDAREESIKLDYSSQIPSASKKKQLENMLYRLNQQKTKLYLHI